MRAYECDAIPSPATVTATDNCDAAVAVVFTEVQDRWQLCKRIYFDANVDGYG